MTDCGFKAVLRLGKGDMRRILNILQAASMAYDEIDENNVYLCTGNPLPSDIELIATWLLNESYQVTFANISKLQREMGYAIADILQEVYCYVNKLDFPPAARIFMLDELAKLE